jgi:peptidoglycan/xylan/chitin deacetylase (PgdA/CDA1 family)
MNTRLSWRRNTSRGTQVALIAVTLVALFGASGALSPAQAAAHNPHNPALLSSVELNETSIDGPALYASSPRVAGAVIAWTGTDHRLNVMKSADGLHYSDKLTIDEVSLMRPAVVHRAADADDSVTLAWIGTDRKRSINILYDVYGTAPKKLTLDESSDSPPALEIRDYFLYVAWRGMDNNHSLNVLPVEIAAQLNLGQKATLTTFSSASGPGIWWDTVNNQMLLSWTATSPAGRLSFATSSDAVTWTVPDNTLLIETSEFSARLIAASATDMARHIFVWTGTDGLLNIRYSASFPQWPLAGARTTFGESVMGAPALGYTGPSGQALVAWTGTDTNHHLNVAIALVPTGADCVAPSGVAAASSDLITHGNTSRKQVALTFDTPRTAVGGASSLIQTLHTRNVVSTWFLTGIWSQAHPALARLAVKDGNELGNLTVDDANLVTPQRSDAFICSEIVQAETIILGKAGKTTRPFFRPPGGLSNDNVRSLAAKIGYRTVTWSINPRDDLSTTTRAQIVSRVLTSAELKNGAIILLHVDGANTPAALGDLITGLHQRGFTLVTLARLMS